MKTFVVSAVSLLATLLCAAATNETTILDFTRAADARGAEVIVSGESRTKGLKPIARQAEWRADTGTLFFSLATNSADYALFRMPAFSRNVQAIPNARRSCDLHWRIRSHKLPDSGKFNATYHLAGGLRYQVALVVPKPGDWNDVIQHTDLGWNRQHIPFDPAKIERLDIVFTGGADLEIAALAFCAPERVPPVHDAGLPPVDPEAFQFYPEPRIATIAPTTQPLAAYGLGVETVGDVPPGAVAAFTDEMKAFYGLSYAPQKGAQIVFARAGNPRTVALLAAHGLTDDFAKIKFDGFALVVDAKGILVAANEPSGLYFGTQALADAVKMASGDSGPAQIRPLRVVDWPRVGNRPFQDMIRTHGHRNKYAVPFYTEMLRRVVFASRFNMLGLELGGFYKWASVPDIPTVRQAWTRADLEAVVDYVNARGMSVYPRMNGLGHVRYWPLAGPREARLYGEDDTTAVLCTAKPAANKMLLDTCAEILGVCAKNPVYRPKYFHMGLDEVQWDTFTLPQTQRCARCRGRAKNAVFRDQVCLLRNWCASNGVRMIMCADMVDDLVNGLNKFRCAEIVNDIPRDVIFDAWSVGDACAIDEHARAGFTSWKILTGYSDSPRGEGTIAGMGLNNCIYNWWLTHAGGYGLLAQRLLADSMWRAAPTQRYAEQKAKIARWADFLMRNWSRKPIPQATENFVSVPLAQKAALAFDLPLRTRFGTVSVSPLVTTGVVQAVEIPQDTCITVAVGRTAASICLLHAAHIAPAERAACFARGGHRSEGLPIAAGTVRYADGTCAPIEISYGWNVADWEQDDEVRGGIWACYPLGCRAAWLGAKHAATLHEWVNPHPRRPIAAIEWRTVNSAARYALFALTLREVCMGQDDVPGRTWDKLSEEVTKNVLKEPARAWAAGEVAARVGRQIPLCMIGDSITWAEMGDTWRKYLLAEVPHVAFVGTHTACLGYAHAGEGGNSTGGVLKRVDDPARVPDAPYYHLMIGINDSSAAKCAADVPVVASNTVKRIWQIVDRLLARPSTRKVFLASILPARVPANPFRDKAGSAANALMRAEVAQRYPAARVVWVEYEQPLRAKLDVWESKPYLGGGLHPAARGYQALAMLFAPILKRAAVPVARADARPGVVVENVWEDAVERTRPLIPGWYVLSFETGAARGKLKVVLETEQAEPKVTKRFEGTARAGARLAFEFMTGYAGYGYEVGAWVLRVTDAAGKEVRPVRVQVEKMRPSRRASKYGVGTFVDAESPISAGEWL